MPFRSDKGQGIRKRDRKMGNENHPSPSSLSVGEIGFRNEVLSILTINLLLPIIFFK